MSDLPSVVVSCEHGGNRIPAGYAPLFVGREGLLASHRGWDPGALRLARVVARRLGAPLHASRVSRLLVELNRSPQHPHLFSSVTRDLPVQEKEEILRRWYEPYRGRGREAVGGRIEAGIRVLHLSVHSFTPVLDGEERQVEIGLLYDPARTREAAFCRGWQAELHIRLEPLPEPIRVRRNQPYRGAADGFTTWLRKRFPPERYLGIELEVNQGLVARGGSVWRSTRKALLDSLSAVLGGSS